MRKRWSMEMSSRICSYNSGIITCLVPLKHWHPALGTICVCVCVCVCVQISLRPHAQKTIIRLSVSMLQCPSTVCVCACVWFWKYICIKLCVCFCLEVQGAPLSIWAVTICSMFWLHILISVDVKWHNTCLNISLLKCMNKWKEMQCKKDCDFSPY